MGGRLLGSAAGFAVLLLAKLAGAQQSTPHLDRLEVPGAPDDGLVLFRPVTNPKPIFFGQFALGWSVDPLHTTNITSNPFTVARSPAAVITHQISTYATVGFELLDRLTLAANLPVTWVETGNQLTGGSPTQTAYSTSGPGLSDMRLDVRGVLYRNDARTLALGAQASIFAPTGSGSVDNFIGDNGTGWLLMINGEYTLPLRRFPLTFVANTGFAFRPENAVNDPVHNNDGLGVGDEWRWAVGAFVPFKDGKFRLGGTIFGQTGVKSSNIIGDTAFTGRNSPIEWNVEARLRFGINGGAERWWVGAGTGTRITDGYGAPDFRLVAMIGAWVPILDSDANSPAAKLAMRQQIRESLKDTDHDGIPDEVDPCPLVPEDHKPPDPNDGCPAPQDRDKDGIPDDQDACPDTPGVFSTDPHKNGCPAPAGDNDRDHDGIPNAQDACPDVPGKPSPDPTKNGCPTHITVDNGGTVHTLQNIQFVTDSATILPASFPILQEVVDLLQSRTGITKMRVEGHTDNVGPADYNMQLSQRRAASVRAWLVGKGIAADRLDSQGYGLTRPVSGEPFAAENNNEPARAKNRRVEFKILVEDGQTVNQ